MLASSPPSLGASASIRARAFPDLREGAIVHEADGVVVLDKPEGVPCQEVRAGDGDDLPARLTRTLAARSGAGEVYVGTHQRLDAGTSGAILYTTDRARNAAVAAAIERHEAEKEYVAAITGRTPKGTLRDRLVRDGETSRVVTHGGQEAVSHVRELARHGDRALVAVRIETGRTHQIRVQLAHRSAPVAGDGLHDGAPAERLMLHAERLAIPSLGLDVRVPVPAAFRRWLEGDARDPLTTPELLAERLRRAADRRHALGHAVSSTTAFRLVHEGGDALPGLAVDVYGDYLLLHVLRDGLPEGPVLDALETLGMRGIYVKRRPVQSSGLADPERDARAPQAPVRGDAAPDEGVVLENGIAYRVRLGDGMSTGLFLDQREHRARVREIAGGRRVLNLFSYTCGFSVAAALGGAVSTTSVDASKRALERGRENLALHGLEGPAHRFVHGDALDVLASLARRKQAFDLVIADPPTYATTKSGRFTQKTWRPLVRACLDVLAPGGVLCATSNDRGLPPGAIVSMVRESVGARKVARLTALGPPRDFASAPGEPLHVRGAWLELAP